MVFSVTKNTHEGGSATRRLIGSTHRKPISRKPHEPAGRLDAVRYSLNLRWQIHWVKLLFASC